MRDNFQPKHPHKILTFSLRRQCKNNASSINIQYRYITILQPITNKRSISINNSCIFRLRIHNQIKLTKLN